MSDRASDTAAPGELRVLIHNSDTAEMADRLHAAQPDARIATCESYEGLADLLAGFRPQAAYSIAFRGRSGFPRDALLGPNGPRWISVGGSGVDHLTPWDAGQVTVTNSAGVAAPMMAEYVFGCVLHFTLDIDGMAAERAAHRWDGSRLMTPLQGKTLLIVGLGHTGRAVAARARAFGMRVIGTRARPEAMQDIDEVHAPADLPGLCGQADVVVLSVPLLAQTRGLVDARALAAMKPGAILVDVSRGGVLDLDAFVNAMRNGPLGAAALDVFPTEPLPADSPVWDLSNVIVSPHCSSVYEGWNMASFDLFLENLEHWRRGAALVNVVDPGRGY